MSLASHRGATVAAGHRMAISRLPAPRFAPALAVAVAVAVALALAPSRAAADDRLAISPRCAQFTSLSGEAPGSEAAWYQHLSLAACAQDASITVAGDPDQLEAMVE